MAILNKTHRMETMGDLKRIKSPI